MGHGLYRVAFKVGNHVFKFPRNEAGEYCNDMEASFRDDCFAVGRWVNWRGFICVMQETLVLIDCKIAYEMSDSTEYNWIGASTMRK